MPKTIQSNYGKFYTFTVLRDIATNNKHRFTVLHLNVYESKGHLKIRRYQQKPIYR